MNMDFFPSGPLGTGDLIGIVVTILGTIGCTASFVMAFRMTIWPGEKNEDHPKYAILREDH
jgi:hypothetical protein